MRTWTALLFVTAGIINFLPVVGVISGAQLESMYQVTLESPDLVVLMRHRAILLAIVGSLLLAAAARPQLRTAATVAGFASMLSYLALAAGEPGANPALQRIAVVDIVGAVALAVAAVLERRRTASPISS